jgi:hypothetical protein
VLYNISSGPAWAQVMKKERVMLNKIFGTIAALFGVMLLLLSLVQPAHAGSYANQAHRGNLCPDGRGIMRPCPWAQWGDLGESRRGGSRHYVQPRTYYTPPRTTYIPPRLLGYRVCGPGGCFFVPN